MATSQRSPFPKPPLSKEPDPFALDADSEEFFAIGDRPTPVIEKIDLELEEDVDAEVVRRSSPEVVMRRRRFRKLVSRAVCAVSLVAIAGLGKSVLAPANAHAAHQTAVAQAPQPVRVLEAPEHLEPVAGEKNPDEVAKTDEVAKADEPAAPVAAAPVAETTPAPSATEAPKKIARAKRDDDFGDLDVKIDVPKIDTSMSF